MPLGYRQPVRLGRGATGHAGAHNDDVVDAIVGDYRLAALEAIARRRRDQDGAWLESETTIAEPVRDVEDGAKITSAVHVRVEADVTIAGKRRAGGECATEWSEVV